MYLTNTKRKLTWDFINFFGDLLKNLGNTREWKNKHLMPNSHVKIVMWWKWKKYKSSAVDGCTEAKNVQKIVELESGKILESAKKVLVTALFSCWCLLSRNQLLLIIDDFSGETSSFPFVRSCRQTKRTPRQAKFTFFVIIYRSFWRVSAPSKWHWWRRWHTPRRCHRHRKSSAGLSFVTGCPFVVDCLNIGIVICLLTDWQRDKSNIRVTSQVSSSVKIECAEGALDCECTVCFGNWSTYI